MEGKIDGETNSGHDMDFQEIVYNEMTLPILALCEIMAEEG